MLVPVLALEWVLASEWALALGLVLETVRVPASVSVRVPALEWAPQFYSQRPAELLP